jgi:Leucine-rich repeat (LRR) protein
MRASTNIRILLAIVMAQIGSLNFVFAQEKEYTELKQALAFPDKVTRLNLSGLNMESLPQEISLFKNLRYLNLRNNHFKIFPEELSKLQNLKVLDVGENLFSSLPQSLSSFESLEELFIDNERNLDFENSLEVIAAIPKLRILHLENNREFPTNFSLQKLQNVNSVFVNKSMLRYVPKEIYLMENLKFIDFQNNPIKKNHMSIYHVTYGVKIR